MQQSELKLVKNIRRWLLFFMLSLILSGATAIDVPRGINWLNRYFFNAGIHTWLSQVTTAINNTNNTYPYLFYGYDWLAFAHLVIAVAFIGPYQEPVRNIWVVQFGRFAALMIIPFAFIAGAVRGIPFWWQLVDSSFGIIALWPLSKCYWLIKKLEQLIPAHHYTRQPKKAPCSNAA